MKNEKNKSQKYNERLFQTVYGNDILPVLQYSKPYYPIPAHISGPFHAAFEAAGSTPCKYATQ